jgi:hypothetical protein
MASTTPSSQARPSSAASRACDAERRDGDGGGERQPGGQGRCRQDENEADCCNFHARRMLLPILCNPFRNILPFVRPNRTNDPMTLDQLRIFIAVAEREHLTRRLKRCG